MCKIMIIPKVNDTKLVKKFMKAAVPYMSKDDNDGLGYAALTTTGELVGERWFNPKYAFTSVKGSISPELANELKPLETVLSGASTTGYNKFGNVSQSLKAVIYHTRMATCDKTMENVHPFVTGNTALIHNGVIRNHDVFGPKTTTCDSESILNGYVQLNMADSMLGIHELTAELNGWYACGVISQNSLGAWNVDIFKDETTDLQAIYVSELKTLVYVTDASIVKKACAKLEWGYSSAYDVEPSTYIRYDGMTGEVVDAIRYDDSSILGLDFDTFSDDIPSYKSYSKYNK